MRWLGFASVDSQANFVWNPHPSLPVRPLYERLKAERILVRYMNYAGWGDGLRMSVGTDEQIEACLAALLQTHDLNERIICHALPPSIARPPKPRFTSN